MSIWIRRAAATLSQASLMEPTTRPRAATSPRLRAPRRVALLGGTTTRDDCAVGLRYLANPGDLVQGPAISDYERCFAEVIGVRHAYSFSAGRVGLFGILKGVGVGAGDVVLLQAPTHIVGANAIRYTVSTPVY